MHSLFCWLGVRSFELAPGSCLSVSRRVAAEYRVLGSSAAIQGGATPVFSLECSTFIDGKIERKTSKMKLFLAKTRENCVFSEYTQEAQGSTECTEEIRNRYPTKEARLKVDSGKWPRSICSGAIFCLGRAAEWFCAHGRGFPCFGLQEQEF